MQKLRWRRGTAASFRRGTATVEYVLLVALMIGVMLLGVSALGDHAAGAFGKIAQLEQVHRGEDSAADRRSNAANTASTEEPTSVEKLSTRHVAGHVLQLVLAGCLIVGIALQAWLSSRKIRQPQTEAEQSPNKQPHPLDKLFEKRQTILHDLSHVIEGHHLSELTVGQVMSNHLTVVDRSASVQELEHILHTQRRHHILVTDKGEQLAGIISDRDLSRRKGDCAAELMTSKITYVSRDTELIVAATTMINMGISALPVVDDGKLVGILTTTDLTLVLQCVLLLAKREQAFA